jgi:hypothetical protein
MFLSYNRNTLFLTSHPKHCLRDSMWLKPPYKDNCTDVDSNIKGAAKSICLECVGEFRRRPESERSCDWQGRRSRRYRCVSSMQPDAVQSQDKPLEARSDSPTGSLNRPVVSQTYRESVDRVLRRFGPAAKARKPPHLIAAFTWVNCSHPTKSRETCVPGGS